MADTDLEKARKIVGQGSPILRAGRGHRLYRVGGIKWTNTHEHVATLVAKGIALGRKEAQAKDEVK